MAEYNVDSVLRAKRLYKYDGQGNRIEEATYSGNGILLTVKTSSYAYYDDGK